MQASDAIASHGERALHRELVAVARDDVAVDGIDPLAADAVACVHDLGREAALLRRERAECDRHGAGGLGGKGREAAGAGGGHTVDFERGRSRRVHRDSTMSAFGTEPRANVDGVRVGRDIGRDEGAAQAKLFLGDGLDLGDDVGACGDDRRRSGEIDVV